MLRIRKIVNTIDSISWILYVSGISSMYVGFFSSNALCVLSRHWSNAFCVRKYVIIF